MVFDDVEKLGKAVAVVFRRNVGGVSSVQVGRTIR